MTKSYIKNVSFKLFLEGVEVRCRTQCSRKLIPSVRTSERESSFSELGTESGFDVVARSSRTESLTQRTDIVHFIQSKCNCAGLDYYGRPLSVSGRPCYILPMFLFI